VHSTPEDLSLDRLFVVYPGEQRFPLQERIKAVGVLPAAKATLK
jgi:hypothetical protein